MLESFLVSARAVLPLFLMMMLGLFARRMGWLREEEIKRFNRLVFNILFPFLVFDSMQRTDLSVAFDPKLIAYCVLATCVTFALSLLVIPKIEPDNRSRGAMIQAIYRSNYVLLGIPLMANLYPGSNLGMMAFCIAFLIPVYNVLAVVILEYYRGGKVGIGQVLRAIAKNPLVIGCVAGLLCLPLSLPPLLGQTISQLSAASTPMALILLGASFQLKQSRQLKRNLRICTTCRLLAVPGVFLPLGALLGFRGMAFVTLIAVLTTPCSVSSFTMAQQMDSDAELAGAIVVYTSALSCLTMFCWTFLFKYMGLF